MVAFAAIFFYTCSELKPSKETFYHIKPVTIPTFKRLLRNGLRI